MAKIVDWEKAIKKLPENEKTKMIDSLKVLRGWEFFDNELGWCGLELIQNLIETSSFLQMSRKGK